MHRWGTAWPGSVQDVSSALLFPAGPIAWDGAALDFQTQPAKPNQALEHHPGFNVTCPPTSAFPGCRFSRGACTLPRPGTCSSAASQPLRCPRWSCCTASSCQTRRAARPRRCANAEPRFTRCSSWKGLRPLLGSHKQGESRGPPSHHARAEPLRVRPHAQRGLGRQEGEPGRWPCGQHHTLGGSWAVTAGPRQPPAAPRPHTPPPPPQGPSGSNANVGRLGRLAKEPEIASDRSRP